jgi:hypothetical protein
VHTLWLRTRVVSQVIQEKVSRAVSALRGTPAEASSTVIPAQGSPGHRDTGTPARIARSVHVEHSHPTNTRCEIRPGVAIKQGRNVLRWPPTKPA